MQIKPIARKRVLTNFKGEEKGQVLFPVQFYCYDRGKVYYIGTDYKTSNIKFDGVFNEKSVSKKMNMLMTTNLLKLRNELFEYAEANKDMPVLMLKAELTAMIKGVSASQLMKKVKSLADYMDEQAEKKDKASTRKMWHGTADKIRKFDADATFESVNVDWLNRFDDSMLKDGLAMNTRSIQMRNLRALINWAIDNDKYTGKNAFKGFKIKEELIEPFVLTAQQIADFRDYPVGDWQKVYRDITMLSFYLGGVNIGDLLLHEGLNQNGRFVFNRRKTGVRVNLPVCEEAMEIINRYRGEEHLLNFLETNWSDYQSFDQHLLKAIKKIGFSRLIKDKVGKMRKVDYHGMFPQVTMYTFRYSFATIAANLEGVSIEDVGRCLGHAWALRGNVTAERYIITTTQKVDRTFKVVMDEMRALKGRSKEEIDAEIKKRDGLT